MRKIIGSLVAIALTLGITAAPAVAVPRHPVLAGAVHADGTWTYEDGHTESHTADYGVITAVSGGTITVLRPDLRRVTVALPSDACVRIGGFVGTVDDLHPRMRAVVISLKASDGSLSAMAVRTGIPLIRPFQPTCGIYAGAVHAVVTITYRDGSTRTFTWDRPSAPSTTGGQTVTAPTTIARPWVTAERIAGELIAKTVRALA